MGNEGLMQEMIGVFGEELKLCGVGPEQNVAVLSEGSILQDYAEAFLRSSEALGANTTHVHLDADANADASARLENIGVNSLGKNSQAMATLKEADLVVDLMLLLFSREQLEIQAAGTRMLLAVEPFEILKRLIPTPELRKRVEAGERRLKAAKTLRFTNEAGSDVIYELDNDAAGAVPVLTEYGYTDTPGRWDHWPSGFLASMGAGSGVNGRVVMDKDDIVLPWKTSLNSPIDLTIKDGMVTDIKGSDDAKRLRDYIEGFEDPRAYAISHIGWGLNEECRWGTDMPGICMEGRAYYGNVLFSTGPNTEFGGDNDTQCHLDLPMQNCSLWLDDELIVKDGDVVPDDMRPAAH